MRNLKRVLSLALALVMMLGMMVIGANAASTDFADADEITYTEAVDVMSALGVLEGDGTNYNPADILTRDQAAKIVCFMLMGPDNAKKLVGSNVYTDVPAKHWAAGYIAYCDSLGILAGNGDGTFNPAGQLTGVAFAKMLLIALGYDATIEGYVNNKNWATNIGTDAIEAGLNIKGVDLSAPVTREQAAQMALQTLKATMVKYASKGTSITIDGIDIVTGASSAEPVTITGEGAANYAGNTGAANGVGTQQFCEKYFSELRKDAGVADDFTRGASYGWYLDKNNSGSFNAATDTRVYNAAKTAVVTYTAKTTAATIVKDLKGYTFNGTKLVAATTQIGATTTAIGDLSFSASTDVIATKLAALTDNGTVVEVYVTSAGAVEDVNVITSTVETIDNIATAANGNVTYTLSVSGAQVDYADDTLNTDDIKLHGTFAKGDVVTTVAGTTYLHVYPTTKIQGAQSAFNGTYNTITVGGTVYPVATGVSDGTDAVAVADFSNSATAANYYLDQYGYVVKTSAVVTVYTNYAQVKGETSRLDVTVDGSTPVVEARFVLADGTVGTYNVKVDYNRATGVYSIAGTTIGDIDVDGAGADTGSALVEGTVQTAVSGVLTAGSVFAYELDGTTIKLQAVGTSTAANAVMNGAPGAAVTTGATAATVNGKTTLLNSDTIYVLYDATKKTATQYVGTLPAGTSLATGTTKVVAKMDAAGSLASAKVVFGVASDVSAIATADYAYVNASVYTTELKNGTTYRVYEGVKADGSKVTLYGDNSGSIVVANGLYTWNNQMNVTAAYTGSHVIGAATYTVVGNQMVNGSTVYNMADAKVVYIDATKTTVNGSSCVVVLAKNGATVTNNAAVIYVVG